MTIKELLQEIGVDENLYNVPNGESVVSPIDANEIAKVKNTTRQEYEAKVLNLKQAQIDWRTIPAPQRGEVISCLLYTSPSPRDQRGSRMPACA